MSADNGIYIAKFKDGWRVIEAAAIDNLSYYPLGSDDEKQEWFRYFGNAKLFATEDEAVLYAWQRSKTEYTEYGVVDLGEGVEFLE